MSIAEDTLCQLDHALDMYQANNERKGFALMHCLKKLKKYVKWRLVCIGFKKAGDETVDLDARLATSTGRLIGNEKAKAARVQAASVIG